MLKSQILTSIKLKPSEQLKPEYFKVSEYTIKVHQSIIARNIGHLASMYLNL